jgi:RNA polymerase sigma-70 factor (ECF subfamily)
MSRELCAEALRLACLLTEHEATASGECHALAALISFQHARAAARTGEEGALILLADQDRSLWDKDLIARGFAHQQKSMMSERLSALHLEAAIASVHASAPSFAKTDWPMLAHHYGLLAELKPTPIVDLNAAIVLAHAEGSGAGLERLDELAGARKLSGYAPYHAARGELLSKLGRTEEAREALAKALACPLNAAERTHLARRMQECDAAARKAEG